MAHPRHAVTQARRAAVAAIVAALVATGCGGGSKAAPPTTTRAPGSPLTATDRLRLAEMLFENYQSGGAHVVASVDYSPQVSVQVQGVVDWTDHRGRLTVTSSFSDGRPQARETLLFSEAAVYEPPSPAQVAALRAKGHPGVRWVQRAVAPRTRPVDEIIALLVSLSATRPDNPEIVGRQGGLTFDHAEVIAGQPTDAYSSTKRSTYWVQRRSAGHLVRFRGLLSGFGGPLEIDLTRFGPVRVTIPRGASVAAAGLLPRS